jgi:hypothetical protein
MLIVAVGPAAFGPVSIAQAPVAPVNGHAGASDARQAIGKRHALLVGCTVYPGLPEKHQLRGPSNDVALTTKLLKERFGFTDDEIVTLVHENAEAMRPTRDNVAREFAALVERVAAGDTVFIMIGGHGSQVKNDNPADSKDVELDGLDEVFLPEDIGGGSVASPAQGFIRDDDIGAWLTAIRAKRAAVFFVADTCHSGTIERGGLDEGSLTRTRFVDPEILDPNVGKLPPATAGNGADAGELSAPAGIADTTTETSTDLGPLIALYAVSDADFEHEEVMPPYERTSGVVYGRLSYTLSDVLTRARRPLTYRELAQQIGWRYQGWSWDQEMAFLNGSSQQFDVAVLGRERWRDRSAVTLVRGEYDMALDVGMLHGVTVGSIYKVFPPTGAAGDDAAVGCVQVAEATPTTARVVECAYSGIPLAPFDQFPERGRCELAYAAAESLKLTLAVLPYGPASPSLDLSETESLVREIAARPSSLIAIAAEGQAPDAYVLVGPDGLYLRRAADAVRATPGDAPGAASPTVDPAAFPPDAFGPFAADASRGSKLDRALEAMAKATNIRRLAASDKLMVIGDPGYPAVELKVVVERWNPKANGFELVDEMHPLETYDGDKVRVSVFNTSGSPVDVTILYLDSAFSIRSYFPTATQVLNGELHNRIIPGGEPASVVFTINDSTIGLEDVIVVATLPGAGVPPQNFAFLEQRGIDRGRAPEPALDTPLGQLLGMAAFGSGDRGGSAAPDLAKYAVHRLSWTVRKK